MLARLNERMNREEEGFTLIELLVVIIIIGILAAIAIPVFLSQRQKGYEASMKTDLRTVAQEVESQNVNNQDYTQTTFAGAVAVANAAITGSGQTVGDSTNIDLSAGNTITWIGSTTTSVLPDGHHEQGRDQPAGLVLQHHRRWHDKDPVHAMTLNTSSIGSASCADQGPGQFAFRVQPFGRSIRAPFEAK